MTTPAASVNGNVMSPVNRDEIVRALGNAAIRSAEKGAGATDGGQAKDYGAAALSYVQAMMAIVAPHTPPPGGGGLQKPAQGASAAS